MGVSFLAGGCSQSAGQVVNLWVGRRCVAFMFGNEVIEQRPRGTPREHTGDDGARELVADQRVLVCWFGSGFGLAQ